MYALPALENRHQSRRPLAVISGPLSHRMNPGCGPTLGDEPIERGDRLVSIDPAVTLNRQRLAGELVDDVQQLEVVPVGGLIELKVDRPHVIGRLCPKAVGRDRGRPESLALAPLARDAQAFLAPQPLVFAPARTQGPVPDATRALRLAPDAGPALAPAE
jgi:hypothetical protein